MPTPSRVSDGRYCRRRGRRGARRREAADAGGARGAAHDGVGVPRAMESSLSLLWERYIWQMLLLCDLLCLALIEVDGGSATCPFGVFLTTASVSAMDTTPSATTDR